MIRLQETYFAERKRTPAAKSELMYHGTSSEFLKSILSKGMQAEPQKKTWQDDPDVGFQTPSRVSLPGSYWTDNLGIAKGSAGRTVGKFGGNRLFVIAQIIARAAYADEDDVRTSISSALEFAFRRSFGTVSGYMFLMVLGAMEADKSLRSKFEDRFAERLHEQLKGSEKHPLNKPLLNEVFEAAFMRMVAHAFKTDPRRAYGAFLDGLERHDRDYETSRERAQENYPSVDALPGEWKDVGTAEKNFLGVQEKLTKQYTKTATDKDDFMRTLRMPQDIGFEGRSRIIGIVELLDDKNLKVRYGTVPERFRKDYKQSWGPNFAIEESIMRHSLKETYFVERKRNKLMICMRNSINNL